MALIPPFFLNTTVALGVPLQDGEVQFSATGFLYGHPTGQVDDQGDNFYWLFLVTNRHVFEQAIQRSQTMMARFNRPFGSEPNMYRLDLSQDDGSPSWFAHPLAENDVAVMYINHEALKSDGIEYAFFEEGRHTCSLEDARTSGVSEGDGVFTLGFPLGNTGEERNYAIVRQGIIARIRNWLSGTTHMFLIDASVFPGNSGGPVLLKPEAIAIEGTQTNAHCSLIGMVSSYLTYTEVAVSEQTGRPRMIFEENSGLASVVPQNVIQQTVSLAVDRLGLRRQVAPAEPRSVE